MKKIILIDNNHSFRQMMEQFAASRGLDLTTFGSIEAMGSIGAFIGYDIAIIENETGHLSGREIVESLSTLFVALPIILISSGIRPSKETADTWPKSVQGFVHKNSGADAILNFALKSA